VTCCQAASSPRLPEEELSGFLKRFEEFSRICVEPQGNETVKMKDQTHVEVGCQADTLMKQIIDQEMSLDSRKVSVHPYENALSAIHHEIQLLNRSIKESDRIAFPFGKWSSLLDKNTTGEWKAVHRFHISLLH
jgi:hypothetical protein